MSTWVSFIVASWVLAVIIGTIGIACVCLAVKPASPIRQETWRVTAYCPNRCCCGKYADGRTASGTRADHHLVAAPPTIPFGTLVDIPGYGTVFVEDRGGAIQGRRLDVLMPTHAEAVAWGVRYLTVTFWN